MTHEGQCIHTFEITQKRCLLCTGHRVECPAYEPRRERIQTKKAGAET